MTSEKTLGYAPEDERSAFELWFEERHYNRLDRNMSDKSYNDPAAHLMWQAWQARAALAKHKEV